MYLTGKVSEMEYSFDKDINNQIKIETNKQKINVTTRLFERATSFIFVLLVFFNNDFNGSSNLEKTPVKNYKKSVEQFNHSTPMKYTTNFISALHQLM